MEPQLPLWRRWRRALYHLLACLVLGLARRLPTGAGRAAGRALARLAVRCRPREAARARANLALALPDRPAAEREALRRRAADALGENLFDGLTAPRWAARGFAGVADDGAVAEARRLLAAGRGLLVLTGHLGCWELLGAYLAARLGGLTVVTGTVHNPPVDRLVNAQRRALGLTPVAREGDLRPVLRALRGGGAVAVLLDQNTRVANVAVPFFGRPAPTPAGFARLALRTGAPVLPVAIRREGAGHRVVHLPALARPGGDGPEAVYSLLRAGNAALEALIRQRPEEWVWFHERW